MTKVNKTYYYATEYSAGIFKTDRGVLFCIFCGINVSYNRKSQHITQHLETSKHIGNYKLKSNNEPVCQQFIKKSFTQARINNQNFIK